MNDPSSLTGDTSSIPVGHFPIKKTNNNRLGFQLKAPNFNQNLGLDARYPPDHRHHANHPQFSRGFTEQEDKDDYASNSDGIKNNNEDEQTIDVGDDDDDDNSSMESRGKRRKLDNFKFVPSKVSAFADLREFDKLWRK